MILESSPSLVILKHVGIPTIPPSSPRSESKYTIYPTSSLLKTPRGATSYQSLSRPVLVPDILPDSFQSYSAQSGRISYWFPKIDTSLSQSQRFVQHICIHMLVALYISSAIFWSWQMRYTKVAYMFCLAAVFNQSREIFPLKSTKFPSIFVTSCWFSASSKNYLSWFAITNRLHMCFPCNSIFDFAHRRATCGYFLPGHHARIPCTVQPYSFQCTSCLLRPRCTAQQSYIWPKVWETLHHVDVALGIVFLPSDTSSLSVQRQPLMQPLSTYIDLY